MKIMKMMMMMFIQKEKKILNVYTFKHAFQILNIHTNKYIIFPQKYRHM